MVVSRGDCPPNTVYTPHSSAGAGLAIFSGCGGVQVVQIALGQAGRLHVVESFENELTLFDLDRQAQALSLLKAVLSVRQQFGFTAGCLSFLFFQEPEPANPGSGEFPPLATLAAPGIQELFSLDPKHYRAGHEGPEFSTFTTEFFLVQALFFVHTVIWVELEI